MDYFMEISQGRIETQGSPSDLSRSGVDFAQFVGFDENQPNEEKPESLSRQISRKLSTLSTFSKNSSNAEIENFDEDAENSEIDEGVQMEASSKGKVKGSVSMNYFKAGANWPILIIVAFSFLFVQLFASGADYWVSVW